MYCSEKPFAMNAAQAQDALLYAESKGIKVMEAFMYRFHPQWVHAEEVVRAGEIGKLQYVHVQFTYNNRDRATSEIYCSVGGWSDL